MNRNGTMLEEHGIHYAFAPFDDAAAAGLHPDVYHWHHAPTNTPGVSHILVRNRTDLLALVDLWNGRGGATWRYSLT